MQDGDQPCRLKAMLYLNLKTNHNSKPNCVPNPKPKCVATKNLRHPQPTHPTPDLTLCFSRGLVCQHNNWPFSAQSLQDRLTGITK